MLWTMGPCKELNLTPHLPAAKLVKRHVGAKGNFWACTSQRYRWKAVTRIEALARQVCYGLRWLDSWLRMRRPPLTTVKSGWIID